VRAGLRRILSRASPPPAGPLDALPEEERRIFHEELTSAERRIVERSLPYSITGVARLKSLIDAVRYCVNGELPGTFAECGVWRGGAVLTMLLTLQELGRDDRDVYLYDTFEGMTEPTPHDVSRYDEPARATWERARREGERPWSGFFGADVFDEDGVRKLLLATGYPERRLHFVRGPVEETLPDSAPPELALLRLDTDWYESTRHELEHLYPRLCPGGVLIVDDYGYWEGARRAVDEYFSGAPAPILLTRIDYTARVGVKR
jgi:O-methyltransferase